MSIFFCKTKSTQIFVAKMSLVKLKMKKLVVTNLWYENLYGGSFENQLVEVKFWCENAFGFIFLFEMSKSMFWCENELRVMFGVKMNLVKVLYEDNLRISSCAKSLHLWDNNLEL